MADAIETLMTQLHLYLSDYSTALAAQQQIVTT